MYKNVDEIIADMEKVYEELNQDQECNEIYKNIGSLTIQINYTDFNEWITQQIENGRCCMLKGKVGEAPVQEYIDSQTFKKVFSGEMQAPEAAMSGLINFEGDFSKMLLLQPVLEKTCNAYRKVITSK